MNPLISIQDNQKKFKILTLDGGGAKGAFSLGVLKKLENEVSVPLHQYFDLVYGTSTGAIIASYLALGFSIDQIFERYLDIIPTVMSKWSAGGRSKALRIAAYREFGKHTFDEVRCMLGIVATRCDYHRPLIFKSDRKLGFANNANFRPGFGVPLADCLLASAAASPFFERCDLELQMGDGSRQTVRAIDGGFVANNPSLYSLMDATVPLRHAQADILLVSVGTGIFPGRPRLSKYIAKSVWLLADAISLLEETLESTANAADFIREVHYPGIRTIRVNPTLSDAGFTTDLLESRTFILRKMYQLGLDARSAP